MQILAFLFFIFAYVDYGNTNNNSDLMQDIYNSIIKPLLDSIGQVLSSIVKGLGDTLNSIFSGARGAILNGWNTATSWVSTVMPPLAPIAPLVILGLSLITIWAGYKILAWML